MEIKEQQINDVMVLELKGRLDTTNYGVLEKKLTSLFDEQKIKIVLNCEGLDYISSSGLRVLLMFLKKANTADGKFVISHLPRNIREIFDISGFTNIFEIYETSDEALKRL